MDTSASKSSALHDLAMSFSPFEKKKKAPDAPPSVKRSLIVVEKALREGERQKVNGKKRKAGSAHLM